jgi:hypothetical protein
MKPFIPIALALLFTPAVAFASPTFPGALQEAANMPCAPQCTLCHRDSAGGYGTLVEGTTAAPTFVKQMIDADPGLEAENPSSVKPALDAVEGLGADSDGDGVGDVAELREGSNPNIKGDATLCGPTYGCGARIAKSERTDWFSLLVGLIVTAGLLVSWRRKIQR